MSDRESDELEEVVSKQQPIKSKTSPLKSLGSSFKSKKNREGWNAKARESSDKLREDGSDNESDSEVSNIPVLEDNKSLTVSSAAHAPQMSVNLVTSYADLNKQLKEKKFPGVDKQVDLKILTSRLPDEANFTNLTYEVTSWDTLMTEVKSWYPESLQKDAS